MAHSRTFTFTIFIFHGCQQVFIFYVVELDGDVGVEFPKNKDKLLGTATPQHDFPKDFYILLYLFFICCIQIKNAVPHALYVLSSK